MGIVSQYAVVEGITMASVGTLQSGSATCGKRKPRKLLPNAVTRIRECTRQFTKSLRLLSLALVVQRSRMEGTAKGTALREIVRPRMRR